MPHRPSPFAFLIPLAAAACANPDAIVEDALATPHAAHAGAPPGRPPVEPASLDIEPTGVAATHAVPVDPQPILPKMDKAWTERRFPEGVDPPAAEEPR